METNQRPSITLAELATAYSSRLLSETAFQTLLSLVIDLPPWLRSKTQQNQRETSD